MSKVRSISRKLLRRGFTLIEAAIVTAVVGIGVVSMVQLFAAGSMANLESTQLTTAVFLANNVNEMLQGKTYSTLKSTYDNANYTPAIDANGTSITGFSDWKQSISVKYVDRNRLTLVVPDTQVEPTSRVTVTISHHNSPIYTASWVVVNPN